MANHERGDTVPDASVLAAYRQKHGVNVNWVLTGEGRMFQPRQEQAHALHAPKGDLREGGGLLGRIAQSLASPQDRSGQQGQTVATKNSELDDFVALPFLDVEASAGHGAVVAIHEEAKSVVSFERAFLRSLGAVPDRCKIITARGDSMTPTIPDGALIVIDHSQREIVNGWISVVNVCGDLLVKRVRRRLDGTVELVSDNPIYPVETIGDDRINQLTVIGRVVYFCRSP